MTTFCLALCTGRLRRGGREWGTAQAGQEGQHQGLLPALEAWQEDQDLDWLDGCVGVHFVQAVD